MLGHEKLKVYGKAVDFYRQAHPVAKQLPKSSSGDQLERASISVVLNIAEAAGRRTQADKAKHYTIARGSCYECSAVLDLAAIMGAINSTQHRSMKSMLNEIAAMLTTIARLN